MKVHDSDHSFELRTDVLISNKGNLNAKILCALVFLLSLLRERNSTRDSAEILHRA